MNNIRRTWEVNIHPFMNGDIVVYARNGLRDFKMPLQVPLWGGYYRIKPPNFIEQLLGITFAEKVEKKRKRVQR